MGTKLRRVGMRTMAGTLAVTVPAVAACSAGPTYDEWAATDGAAGRINLDDVQDAFKRATSATDFERLVNEVYEGDGIVMVLAKQEDNGLVVEGWEDLDGNYTIEDDKDDLLFSITQGSDNNHDMRGHGANGYYNSGFGGGGFLFGYMIGSAFAPRGYMYHTSPNRGVGMTRARDRYRGSARYRSQVSRNSGYFKKQKFASSKYNSRVSSGRQSYQGKQRSTGAFKSSGTGVRSSWGSASRGGGFGRGGGRSGGFRGFGGGQTIIGSQMGHDIRHG